MFDLTGKVAVITGGASGIGLATVRRLAAAGARVVIGDLSPAEDLAAEVDGIARRVDVADEDQVAALMGDAVERFGRLDVIVNNAGIAIDRGRFADHDRDAYAGQFEVNLLGPVYGIKHGARHMGTGGSIVNTSSMAGMLGVPETASYAASKWALVGITKVAALELAPRGIRVNAVCPTNLSHVMTTVDIDVAEGTIALSEFLQPLDRLATPEEVAAAIHFLASDDAAMITGHALPIDGGMSAGPSVQAIDAALDLRQRSAGSAAG